MFRSLGQIFLLAKGVDALGRKASGAPLRAFGTLAVIWILARVISWNIPANIDLDPLDPLRGHAATRDIRKMQDSGTISLAGIQTSVPLVPSDIVDKKHASVIISYPAPRLIDQNPVRLPASKQSLSLWTLRPQFIAYRLTPADSPRRTGGLLRGAGSGSLAMRTMPAKQSGQRLKGYFWVFTRHTSHANGSEATGAGATISNGQYGGSQIGAILSYPILTKLDPELLVYGRLSAALTPLTQKELAFGVRLHPFDDLPISLHAEKRLSADSGRDRGTAFFAAGGTGPDPIVEKLALETYAQAGYVLGDDETYFFDGFATLQRAIMESDRKKLSLGIGAWVGGQRNVARLDLGPRADFRIPLGKKSARIAVDWRVRVAGDAQPKNGMAITLSTNF